MISKDRPRKVARRNPEVRQWNARKIWMGRRREKMERKRALPVRERS
jgi:hypothetical protein